jgi:hypothetical protein
MGRGYMCLCATPRYERFYDIFARSPHTIAKWTIRSRVLCNGETFVSVAAGNRKNTGVYKERLEMRGDCKIYELRICVMQFDYAIK